MRGATRNAPSAPEWCAESCRQRPRTSSQKKIVRDRYFTLRYDTRIDTTLLTMHRSIVAPLLLGGYRPQTPRVGGEDCEKLSIASFQMMHAAILEIAAPSGISGGKPGSAAPSGICAEYSATSGNKKNDGSQVGARRMDSNVVNSE